MKKSIIPIVVSFLVISIYLFLSSSKGQGFTVVFYNVENLFDYTDDPNTDDAEFLPEARIPWTAERYAVKLDRIAQVLSSIDESDLPALIGLCEIENRGVLEDLVNQRALKKGKYGIIHFDSPDERGIDNALLYRKNAFEPINKMAFHVNISDDPEDATRDILYVKGIVNKSPSDTLHLFVNHWPSRSGGKETSENKRLDAARVLRSKVDSIFQTNRWANIIIIGDFNDEPYDKSLYEILEAFNPTYNPKSEISLYNMMAEAYHDGQGSIYYKSWQVFDQIILSANLVIKTSGLVLPEFEAKIFSPDWLLFKDSDGTARPNRTAGKDYYGGYSDHLPVYVKFMIK